VYSNPKIKKSIIPHVPPTKIIFIHALEFENALYMVPTLLNIDI
jgi:hypothetical protein